MSFMSGVMMGASIGKGIHDMVTGSKNHQQNSASEIVQKYSTVEEFALVANVAGRRRYRMAALVANTPLAVLLEKQLIRLEYVSKVQANPVTGSLLIFYNGNDEALDNIMAGIRDRIVVVQTNSANSHTAEHKNSCKCNLPATTYARSWKGTGNVINNWVRSATNDTFDISGLLSMVFLLRGLYRVIMMGDRPNGSSLVWWALHLMKGWKA